MSNEEINRIIAARSALLDLYGDRATSFASLFVASIFGLVTISAIIYSISSTIGADALIVLNIVDVIIFIISVSTYATFVYVAIYTFRRYAFYADLSDKLMNRELSEEAKLNDLPVTIVKPENRQDLSELRKIAKQHDSSLTKEDLRFMYTSYAVYCDYGSYLQDKTRGKHVINNTKKLKLAIFGVFAALSILTYYPLIIKLIRHLLTHVF